MKKLIFPLIFILIFLCGCSEETTAAAADAGEALLRTVVESIDWEELQGYLEQGVEAVLEKFPALKKLTNRKDMQELLKEHGLKLIREYLNSTDPEVQENAEKLGAIIKILSPELTDEVDAVLAG